MGACGNRLISGIILMSFVSVSKLLPEDRDMVKQTVNRRQDGTFGPGNQLGKQFRPGESGNPTGRPTERPLTVALRDALDANDGELVETLAQVAIDKAKGGDFRYFKEIMDRVDGKVTDKVQHDGQLGIFSQLVADRKGVPDEELARHMRTAGLDGTD